MEKENRKIINVMKAIMLFIVLSLLILLITLITCTEKILIFFGNDKYKIIVGILVLFLGIITLLSLVTIIIKLTNKIINLKNEKRK